MDDGYSSAYREADRADLAEQRLGIATRALTNIAAEDGTPYGTTASQALEDIKTHVLKAHA